MSRTNCLLLIAIGLVGILKLASSATCSYEVDERNGRYMCVFVNQNIQSELDMLPIEGVHINTYGIEQVANLWHRDSTIQIFPSLIIDYFPNLLSASLGGSHMTLFNRAITNCNKLESINVVNNRISSVPGGIFSNCQNLTTLSFLFNQIDNINSDAFQGLANLKVMELAWNRITSFNPNVFASLSKLEILTINNNEIVELSPEIFRLFPMLVDLNLGFNKIKSWNNTILANNPNVETLRLAGNEIQTLDGRAFASLLNLRTLSIGGLLEEIPALQNLQQLRALYLDDNKFKSISSDPFIYMPNLQTLSLDNNEIESLNFTTRTNVVLGNLHNLFLNNNKLTSIPENSTFIQQQLFRLHLSGNQLEKITANSIRPIQQLTYLDISNNRISKIDRELFDDIRRLELRAGGNDCVNENHIISSKEDFEKRVADKLSHCFNFAIAKQINLVVLIAGLLVAFITKF